MADDRSKRIAKNAGYLYLRMFLTMIVSLFTSRIVLNTLGFDDFGIYNVVGSVVVFFSFLKHALKNATSRYITYELGSGNNERLHVIYSMAINSHIILALFLFIVLEIGGVWFLNNKLNIPEGRMYAANWCFQFSLLNFCISIIQTPLESNIVAHERFNFYAITSIVHVVLNLVSVYILVYSPIDKLITYAFFLMFNVLSIFICYVVYCRRQFKDVRYRKTWDFSILKDFSKYSGWSLLVNMACGFSHQSISILFNQFLGTIANAALGVCTQVISQLNSFVSNFTHAFNPQIIKSYAAGDKSYFFKLVFSSSKISYILMLFIAIPLCSNIEIVLTVWLKEFPPMTPTLIFVTVIYYLIEALQAPLVQAVHANGNIKVHQIWVASFNLISIPLMYLVLYLGWRGEFVIVMWTAANLASAIFRTIYLGKLVDFPVKNYLRDVILKVGLFTVLCVPIPFIFARVVTNPWISFFGSCIISVILTIVVGLFVALDCSERQLLYRVPIISKAIDKVLSFTKCCNK